MKMITSTLACAFVLAFGSAQLHAQESGRGGASRLIDRGQQITTPAEAEALKPGDAVAMVCSKCKSVAVTHVTTEKGHIKTMTPGEKHLCSGCKSTITVMGEGKGAKDKVTHVCEKCGENSVFCCATKAGSAPTKGMERRE